MPLVQRTETWQSNKHISAEQTLLALIIKAYMSSTQLQGLFVGASGDGVSGTAETEYHSRQLKPSVLMIS